ncbi:hypothetical protein DIPPA_03342 [Diplonema papillatum]|nr:hypothetical protein DIPPA_03342 [Diplonema papillatum]
MMPRAVVFASMLALAVSTARPECSRVVPSCGGTVCCAVNWVLTSDARCVHANGTACGACGQQQGLAACGFTPENSGAPYATMLDAAGNEVQGGSVVTTQGTARATTKPPPTTPNNGWDFALATYDGMDGWHDIPASEFSSFRGFLIGLTATIPSFYTDTGFTILYTCRGMNAASGFVGCDIFFFMYRCPPCASRHGNIADSLMVMDEPTWYVGNCGPVFKLNKDLGAEHQFVVFQAETAAETRVRVPVDEPVEYIFWAMAGKSVICSSIADEAACVAAVGSCEWLAGSDICKPKGCDKPTSFQGPLQPKCTVCVDDEADFIPEVIFS